MKSNQPTEGEPADMSKGGETHQDASDEDPFLTTNQGVVIPRQPEFFEGRRAWAHSARRFLMDANRDLKAIGLAGVPGLAKRANVMGMAGVAEFGSANDIAGSINAARGGRIWERDSQ